MTNHARWLECMAHARDWQARLRAHECEAESQCDDGCEVEYQLASWLEAADEASNGNRQEN